MRQGDALPVVQLPLLYVLRTLSLPTVLPSQTGPQRTLAPSILAIMCELVVPGGRDWPREQRRASSDFVTPVVARITCSQSLESSGGVFGLNNSTS